jgi:hypothetical protein
MAQGKMFSPWALRQLFLTHDSSTPRNDLITDTLWMASHSNVLKAWIFCCCGETEYEQSLQSSNKAKTHQMVLIVGNLAEPSSCSAAQCEAVPAPAPAHPEVS